MKAFQITTAIVLFALLLLQCSASFSPEEKTVSVKSELQETVSDFDSSRLTKELPRQIEAMKTFIQQQNGKYSSKLAIFIDMRIQSNYFRFFVVDLLKDSIVERCLVAHGLGSETAIQDSLRFSNTPNSNMTSLGTYKIGAAYVGNFSRSFKLHGLDPTNSKAFDRLVVLHRFSCVPDEEQPYPICNSLGCAMVSEAIFPKLEKYIDSQAKPVLMEIYY